MKALAAVLMTALGAGIVAASDLLIRKPGIDHLHGLDAHTYDVVGTLLVMFGVLGFMASIFEGSDD